MTCWGCGKSWPGRNHVRVVVWLTELRQEAELCIPCFAERCPASPTDSALAQYPPPQIRTHRAKAKQRVTSH